MTSTQLLPFAIDHGAKNCWNYVGIVVQNPLDKRFLAVEECNDKGWCVPAGFVEPNESFFDAAIRECKEEAAIDLKIVGVVRFYQS